MILRPKVVGNWKMNTTVHDIGGLDLIMSGKFCDVIVCPTDVQMHHVVKAAREVGFFAGGQDCHAKQSGAYTGETSATFLKVEGAKYVILGHSERRAKGETSNMVHDKAMAADEANLIGIICVGESEGEYLVGDTLEVVENQLDKSIPEGFSGVIAYEPVWAIGTGRTPTATEVSTVHELIKEWVKVNLDGDIHVIYGGSVKPENAEWLIAIDEVDGFLIGGVSLNINSFNDVIKIVDGYTCDVMA